MPCRPVQHMSSKQFARDCVRLAEQADTPELREKLLNLAREWMRAVMDEEDIVMSRQGYTPRGSRTDRCGFFGRGEQGRAHADRGTQPEHLDLKRPRFLLRIKF